MADAKKTDQEISREIWMLYSNTARVDQYEPTWVFPDWQIIKSVAEGSQDKFEDVSDYICFTEGFKDGIVFKNDFGTRVSQDGYIVGSTSWIFCGRNKVSKEDIERWSRNDWIVIYRDIDIEPNRLRFDKSMPRNERSEFSRYYINHMYQRRVYGAYNLKSPEGMEFGPMTDVRMLIAQIKSYYG